MSALGMMGYITDLDLISPLITQIINANGHDLNSLLFDFLNEVLYLFNSGKMLVVSDIKIQHFDEINFTIKAICKGEIFVKNKHPSGTEIKAITYSNMQIFKNEQCYETYVILDI